MTLIKIVNACRILGIQKLVQVFRFWFEEDVIYLYNNYKHLLKNMKEKTLEPTK